jgi:hypothetical protein
MPGSIWDECLHDTLDLKMLDLKNNPTPSDLEKRLGREFIDVFFKTCTPIEKILFGRDRPLTGPADRQMWINPADRIEMTRCDGICIREQPCETDCLQALSHRGILEIGEKIEAQIAAEHKLAVSAAVRETEELER